jgi:hypothetical protein
VRVRRSAAQLALCCIAVGALVGCGQVLGIEEAHVDPTLEARADAGGAAQNLGPDSGASITEITASIGDTGGDGGGAGTSAASDPGGAAGSEADSL